MKAFCSPLAGAVVLRQYRGDEPKFFFVDSRCEWQGVEAIHLLSVVDDWEEVESDNETTLLGECISSHRLRVGTLLVQGLLQGVSPQLELDVLDEVELLLKEGLEAEALLAQLLIAPLKRPDRADSLAQAALSNGYAAIGALFQQLRDHQQLLQRFVSAWLRVPSDHFIAVAGGRERLWHRLVTSGVLRRVLAAENSEAFRLAWNKLAYNENQLEARKALTAIGNTLSMFLHPSAGKKYSREAAYSETVRHVRDDERSIIPHHKTPRVHWEEALERAHKQVQAIVKAVAAGKDTKATRFLESLLREQLGGGEHSHAVKSLCNIAQKCADLFRIDFERQCLERALGLDSNDPWLLIQWGDHLKRVGEFSESIESLRRACVGPHATIAITSVADVYAQQGLFDDAVRTYKSIDNWVQSDLVRTALADILRRQGRLIEAEAEYDEVFRLWQYSDRAVAGKAECAKLMGRCEDALALYESLSAWPNVEWRSAIIYKSARCNILKQANRLSDAFALADEIVSSAPFFLSARILRGTILGLLGSVDKGLKDICYSSHDVPKSFGTWIRPYYHGLLLLKQRRYQKAREQLLKRLEAALVAGDNEVVVRLGASLAFIQGREFGNAANILNGLPGITDRFTRYVQNVLLLHIASVQRDDEQVGRIVNELKEACDSDARIQAVVDVLKRRQFEDAIEYEIELLLRIAA